MNMLLHFELNCFGRRNLVVRLMEADTALLPAKPIQSLGLQLLGLEWWCCWVICEFLGSSLAGPFPQPVRHHTLLLWLEICGVANSLLRNWAPLGSVMWGCVNSTKAFPVCEEPALNPAGAPWHVGSQTWNQLNVESAQHGISFFSSKLRQQ